MRISAFLSCSKAANYLRLGRLPQGEGLLLLQQGPGVSRPAPGQAGGLAVLLPLQQVPQCVLHKTGMFREEGRATGGGRFQSCIGFQTSLTTAVMARGILYLSITHMSLSLLEL